MKKFACRGIIFLLLILSSKAQLVRAEPSSIELTSNCPRGFELVAGNRCELRSLYQFYNSTQNQGVGGTQTGLPKYRDGFSPQQIDLGRYLFFDPILSGDQSLSCASCHHIDKAFTDGLAVSIGAQGQLAKRSAPSLWNSAFQQRFFWDARANSLEEQALGPLYAPNEMNSTREGLLKRLSQSQHYQRLFADAFPNSKAVYLHDLYTALTAFQTSLVSLNSRYDQYAHGNHEALNEQEIKGMNVFRSFVARCAECHTPPLFTNNQVAVIGTPEPQGKDLDIGAQKTFGSIKLRAGFKVPTLRNITKTAPYMHSGGFKNLKETVRFYTKGRGHAVPSGEDLHIHWHIWEPELAEHEIDEIVSFLATLSDESFLPKVPLNVPSGLTPISAAGTVSVK